MVETLGEALDKGWRLTVRCAHHRDGLKSTTPCIGRQELSLQTMIWTHGRRCPVTYLQGKLRCPKCGATQVMLVWTPPPKAEAVPRRAAR